MMKNVPVPLSTDLWNDGGTHVREYKIPICPEWGWATGKDCRGHHQGSSTPLACGFSVEELERGQFLVRFI